MGYNREQILDMYNSRMRSLSTRMARDQEDRDTVAYNQYIARQETMAKANLALSALKTVGGIKDRRLGRLLDQTFPGGADKFGDPKKFEMKAPMSWKEFKGNLGTGKNVIEGLKRLTPGGQIQETEEYTKFQAQQEDIKAKAAEKKDYSGEPVFTEDDKAMGDEETVFTEEDLAMPDQETIMTEEELTGEKQLTQEEISEMGADVSYQQRDLAEYMRDKDIGGGGEPFKRREFDIGTDTPAIDESKIGTGVAKSTFEDPYKNVQLGPDRPDPSLFLKPSDPDYRKIRGEASKVMKAESQKQAAEALKARAAAKSIVPDVKEELYQKPGAMAKLQSFLPGGKTGMETFEEGMERSMMEGLNIPTPRGKGVGVDTAALAMNDTFAPTGEKLGAPVEIPDATTGAGRLAGLAGKATKGLGALQTGVGFVSDIKGLAGGDLTKEQEVLTGAKVLKTGVDVGSKLLARKGGEQALKSGAGAVAKGVGAGIGAGVGIYTGGKALLDEDLTDVQRVGGGMTAAGSAMLGASALNIWNPAGWVGGAIGTGLTVGGSLMQAFGGKRKRAPAPKRKIDLSRYYQRGRR